MTKINIAIVRGIGDSGKGYAKDLIKGIREEFNLKLKYSKYQR